MKSTLRYTTMIMLIIEVGLLLPTAAKAGSSLGPFVLYSADSINSIRLQFVGQMKTTYDNRDNGVNTERTDKLTMEARRLRFTLSGTVYDANLFYKVHLSLAPNSLELMDFYFNYEYCPCLQFRFGQYKTPFTRYRIQSFQRLIFVDWAIVSKYFGTERQTGFAFHNGYERPPQYGYILGVFSGNNARASHAIGLSEVYGDDVPNPSDLADPGTIDEFHPELFLHLAYNGNNINISSNSDEAKTGLRYSFGLSGVWDLFPTDYYDFSLRLSPELLVKYRGLSALAVGYIGYSEFGAPSKIKPAMAGGLFQAGYRISERYEMVVRYALVDFTTRLTDNAGRRAEQLISDSGDDPDVIALYQNAGKVLKECELAAVLTIYISGNFLKLQNECGWLRHCYTDDNQDDYRLRSQFQLSF